MQQVCCPFNKHHVMPQNRLIFHLSKECRDKKLNKHLFKHCPYNFSHIFKGEEIENHVQNCPDQIIPEQIILSQEEPNLLPIQFEGNSEWGMKNMMEEEKPIQQEEDILFLEQFQNLKIERQPDVWDIIWQQQLNNEDDII